MPIDLAAVDWLYVAVLSALVFISALIGNLLAFKHRVKAAVTAVVFAGLFVFWTYYPHGLPLPTTLTVQKATVAPAAPPAAPHNPVTDVTPPASTPR